MHVILGNGARPVGALGQFSFRRLDRLVDWARSFSSLTLRKCHNGLRRKRSDPDSRLCQESANSLIARGWKNVHSKAQVQTTLWDGAPRQLTPSTPASYILRARLRSLPYPQSHATEKQNKPKDA